MDRADALAGFGMLAIIVGLVIVHPALLLVAIGYVLVTAAVARAN